VYLSKSKSTVSIQSAIWLFEQWTNSICKFQFNYWKWN